MVRCAVQMVYLAEAREQWPIVSSDNQMIYEETKHMQSHVHTLEGGAQNDNVWKFSLYVKYIW